MSSWLNSYRVVIRLVVNMVIFHAGEQSREASIRLSDLRHHISFTYFVPTTRLQI